MICKSAIKGCLPSLCNNSCTWHVGQWPGALGKWPAFAIALQQALLVLAIVPHGQLVERDFNCLKHVQTINGIWFDFHVGWVGIPKFHQSNSIHLACWNWILFCVEHHGLIAMDVGMPGGVRISRLCKFVSEVVLGAPIRNPDSKVSGYHMTFETLPFINWSTVWSTPEIISSCHETIQCLQSLETCWFMLFLVGCFISGTHNKKNYIKDNWKKFWKYQTSCLFKEKMFWWKKNLMWGSCKHSIHSGTFGLSPAEFPGAISTEIMVLSMGMGKRLENMGMWLAKSWWIGEHLFSFFRCYGQLDPQLR